MGQNASDTDNWDAIPGSILDESLLVPKKAQASPLPLNIVCAEEQSSPTGTLHSRLDALNAKYSYHVEQARIISDEVSHLLKEFQGSFDHAQFSSIAVEKTLPSFHIETRKKILTRKPRSLLFSANPRLSDLMITATIDGTLQIWSQQTRRPVKVVHLVPKRSQSLIPEDACFSTKQDALFIALINRNNIENDADFGSVWKIDLYQDDKEPGPALSNRQITPDRNVHTKCISSIGNIRDSDYECFATGGSDRRVAVWKMAESTRATCVEAHRCHTSLVNSICQDYTCGNLWSGGADKY